MKDMKNNTVSFFMLLSTSACLFGCGPRLPDDLPKLHPLTVTVVQEGQALPDANIALYPADHSFSRWGQTDMTDASGTVKFKTNNRYPGVPAGRYKVTVRKIMRDPNPYVRHASDHPDSPGLRQFYQAEKTLKTYALVDPVFENFDTTPLEIEVVAGKNDEQVDVGAKVKIEIRNTP